MSVGEVSSAHQRGPLIRALSTQPPSLSCCELSQRVGRQGAQRCALRSRQLSRPLASAGAGVWRLRRAWPSWLSSQWTGKVRRAVQCSSVDAASRLGSRASLEGICGRVNEGQRAPMAPSSTNGIRELNSSVWPQPFAAYSRSGRRCPLTLATCTASSGAKRHHRPGQASASRACSTFAGSW